MPASLRAALCLFLCASVLAVAQGKAGNEPDERDLAESESGDNIPPSWPFIEVIVTDKIPLSWPFVLAGQGVNVWVSVTNDHQKYKVRIINDALLNLRASEVIPHVPRGKIVEFEFQTRQAGKYEVQYAFKNNMVELGVYYAGSANSLPAALPSRGTTKQPPSGLGEHYAHDLEDEIQGEWPRSDHEVYPAHYHEALPLGISEYVTNVDGGHEMYPAPHIKDVIQGECPRSDHECLQKEQESTEDYCKYATSQSLESNCQAIDWSGEAPRRACLAAMINLVYCAVDKQSVTPLNPRWLNDSTGFELFRDPLKDREETFAAVYRYVGMHKSAPRYIVVFRGTSFCRTWTALRDLRIGCRIIINDDPFCCERFTSAYEKVKKLVKYLKDRPVANFPWGIGGDLQRGLRYHDSLRIPTGKDPVVWLTGHSLGAWMALNVGRQLMLERHNLSTYLFNPPTAVACNQYSCFKWVCEKGIRVAEAIRCKKRLDPKLMKDQLEKLRDWTPFAYTHKNDPVCKGFNRYFEKQTNLDRRIMVLPSVVLCKNSGAEILISSHRLELWLNSNTRLKYECNRYPVPREGTIRAHQHKERVSIV
ncbi:hypothetical protein BRADI_3g15638v3 [Brachypodium distachyon]|uniref:Fungal lipase-like domain-containing protein n=1 Tax=Brachypodium distachyon TaxID=15368 RepID=A0A0Q3F6Y6_BRADI|nr:hypothetical protein BRADI_3g15638v3 [Brachypodium distachyon]